MKVTLRYSGTLSDPDSLPRLREDFQDIAATQRWPVERMDGREAPAPRGGGRLLAPALTLGGLKVVVHPQTDPLWLTFNEAGVLTRLAPLPRTPGPIEGALALPVGVALHQAQASIQTSIGGSRLHLTVVGLLDYLKSAYVHDLRVSDEAGYWDDRDAESLRRLMDER